MKIEKVFYQGKFCITSTFLDTTLGAEAALEEGETMEEAMVSLRDRMRVVAQSLEEPKQEIIGGPFVSLQKATAPPKEINLQSEVVEIINDCKTLEQLAKFKDRCNTKELMKHYMDKVKELSK